MTSQQRTRARQRLEKLGLPVPDDLKKYARGWQKGKPRKTEPPKKKENMSTRERFYARQRFIALGLPVPVWCATQSQSKPIPTTKGMTMQQYESFEKPVWATFKAVDSTGDAWFFETEPRLNNGAWSCAQRISFLGEVACPNFVKSKRRI